ncbi:MAG: (Fe-S)-binding protein [Deltaproteobacteria bacterium]|nr:(Fe-S)-binding protein [Deltaproteobacteria bacterium]
METVQLFITCMGENLLPDVLKKMVLLLERLGVRCELPEAQTCCGQPFFNSGFQAEGREMALGWMKAFADTEGYIVAPSGSCVEFVKHRYPGMFPEGSAEHERAVRLAGRVLEFSQFLVNVLKVKDVGASFPHPVVCHYPCHLTRGLGVRSEPLELLQAVRGLELIELNESDTCCGFGGIFSVVYPEVSRAMMETKVKNIIASNAEVVVVSEPGCLLNIRGGLVKVDSRVRAMHLIEILAGEGAA